MYIYLLLTIFVLCLLLLLAFNRSIIRLRTKRISIYKWMNIGKSNRYHLDNKAKLKSLERKTRLINKTRSEYLKLYKSCDEPVILPFPHRSVWRPFPLIQVLPAQGEDNRRGKRTTAHTTRLVTPKGWQIREPRP